MMEFSLKFIDGKLQQFLQTASCLVFGHCCPGGGKTSIILLRTTASASVGFSSFPSAMTGTLNKCWSNSNDTCLELFAAHIFSTRPLNMVK
jgi:hypothetical protein